MGVDRPGALLSLLLRSLPHLPRTVQEGQLNLETCFHNQLHLAHRQTLPFGHYQKLIHSPRFFFVAKIGLLSCKTTCHGNENGFPEVVGDKKTM